MNEKQSLNLLRSVLTGTAITPGEDGYDDARATWDTAVEHRPQLVVMPETSSDVVAAVQYAQEHGLPVAVQGTGHGPIFGCEGGLLINTRRMKRIEIDAERRIARIEAGVTWGEVLEAAQPHGLAGLAGTSPGVGVAGYTLGGGTGWLARRYGYASDSLVAAEVVTGDGRLLRVTEKEYADLFWALRGGGGNFGAVTAMEFRLFPIAQVYGGSLYFPIERAVEVFGAYAVWTRTLPDSMTSTICIQHVPEAPFFPAPVRGRSFVVIQGCLIGDEAAGTGMLETLRALGPVMDDFAMMPFREIGRIAKEPELALWAHTGTESLTELTPELIRNIVDVAGDRSQTSLTIIAVRHLDGAYAKRSESVSAATRPDTPFVMVSVGIAWSPEMRNQIVSDTAGLMEVCRPHRSGAPLLNFIGWSGRDRADDGELFSNEKAWLLATVKKRYDPGNLFRFGMPIAIPEAAAA